MSLGYGGFARKVAEDDQTVIYEYGAYNLNTDDERVSNFDDRIHDGTIAIDKTALVEPEIHEKIKRYPGGKKERIVKRIPRSFSIGLLVAEGKVVLESSRFCWKSVGNTPFIAWHILDEIFTDYQVNGELPEKTSCHW